MVMVKATIRDSDGEHRDLLSTNADGGRRMQEHTTQPLERGVIGAIPGIVIQCAVAAEVEDVYSAFTIGDSGGSEERSTDHLKWLGVAEEEVENRMVEGVVSVEHKYIDLAVYAFDGDGVSYPGSTHFPPTAPFGIRVALILVFPVECMVGAENESSNMFWYD